MIRIVATDVDGTVVQESAGTIDERYYTTIRALHKQGIQVVIASGRPYSSLYALFEPVADIVWFIADGGACYQTTGEMVTLGQFPRDWAVEIWQDIGKIPGMDVMYCGKDLVYTPRADSELYHLVRGTYHMNVEATGGWDCIPEEPTSKISLYRSADVEEYTKQYFTSKWESRIRIIPAGEWWVDCGMPNVHKGSTLQKIMDQHGYHASELMASGDNINDLEMVSMAEIRLAVATARDEVKQAATKIIPGYDEVGVLKEWEALLNLDSTL